MPNLTIVGNVATAPESRVTGAGKPFVRFGVIENSGHVDRESGKWVEDDATFWPVTVWGDPSVNVAESLVVGARVVIVGRTRTNAWETEDGEKRSRVEVVADEVAASARFARLRIAKVERESSGSHIAPPVPAGAGAPF